MKPDSAPEVSPRLEIWFEFASTYSYLTVSRAERLLTEAGIDFVWRPFLLGPIFQAKGWATSPFVLDEVKGAYMWRDMERRAARYALPFCRPSIFPMNGLLAARIMTAALDQDWCGDFARAVFAAQFAQGRDISDETVLCDALRDCGVQDRHWLAMARQDQVKARLRDLTEEARSHGVFGAPSFRIGDELFWGDDRLEDAMAFVLGNR